LTGATGGANGDRWWGPVRALGPAAEKFGVTVAGGLASGGDEVSLRRAGGIANAFWPVAGGAILSMFGLGIVGIPAIIYGIYQLTRKDANLEKGREIYAQYEPKTAPASSATHTVSVDPAPSPMAAFDPAVRGPDAVRLLPRSGMSNTEITSLFDDEARGRGATDRTRDGASTFDRTVYGGFAPGVS